MKEEIVGVGAQTVWSSSGHDGLALQDRKMVLLYDGGYYPCSGQICCDARVFDTCECAAGQRLSVELEQPICCCHKISTNHKNHVLHLVCSCHHPARKVCHQADRGGPAH